MCLDSDAIFWLGFVKSVKGGMSCSLGPDPIISDVHLRAHSYISTYPLLPDECKQAASRLKKTFINVSWTNLR